MQISDTVGLCQGKPREGGPIAAPASRPTGRAAGRTLIGKLQLEAGRSPAITIREVRLPLQADMNTRARWSGTNPARLGVLDLKGERDQRLFGVAEQH